MLVLVVVVALLLTACGGSSSGSGPGGSATNLLRQTFSGPHRVTSGKLSFAVSITPSGSSTLTQPFGLSFGGPFQSRGTGKLPASNFTVAFSAQGHTGSLSIISTGTQGFVSLSGASYQLPAASFQQLESSFSSIASSGGGSTSRTGTLSKLGINPLDWLTNPTIVGRQRVAGTPTTHIRAQVNVPALLRDLNTFLQKASSLGVAGVSRLSSGISASQQSRIAAEVQHPRFDVWTGNGDRTVRRLTVGLTIPVSGQISSLLGGMRSAGIQLSLQYEDLNQPQTITAPTNIKPYSVFAGKLQTLFQEVEGSLAAGALGGASGAGSGSGSGAGSGSGGAGSGSGSGGTGTTSGGTNAYTQCIAAAGNDISKMQKCAPLLSSSGG